MKFLSLALSVIVMFQTAVATASSSQLRESLAARLQIPSALVPQNAVRYCQVTVSVPKIGRSSEIFFYSPEAAEEIGSSSGGSQTRVQRTLSIRERLDLSSKLTPGGWSEIYAEFRNAVGRVADDAVEGVSTDPSQFAAQKGRFTSEDSVVEWDCGNLK